MKYSNLKSEYIKEQIQGRKFGCEYVESLIKIEQLALGKNFGMVTGYMIKGLQEKYSKEWETIWLEVNPKQYYANIAHKKKREEKRKKEEETLDTKMDKEIEINKTDWVKAGGRI